MTSASFNRTVCFPFCNNVLLSSIKFIKNNEILLNGRKLSKLAIALTNIFIIYLTKLLFGKKIDSN